MIRVERRQHILALNGHKTSTTLRRTVDADVGDVHHRYIGRVRLPDVEQGRSSDVSEETTLDATQKDVRIKRPRMRCNFHSQDMRSREETHSVHPGAEPIQDNGTTFLLRVTDVFSKVTWCDSLKNKSSTSIRNVLDVVFPDGVRTLTLHTGR